MRFASLAVLRVFGWLALLTRSDRAILAVLAWLLPGGHLCQLRLIVSPRVHLASGPAAGAWWPWALRSSVPHLPAPEYLDQRAHPPLPCSRARR
jgi:hypothetical protein